MGERSLSDDLTRRLALCGVNGKHLLCHTPSTWKTNSSDGAGLVIVISMAGFGRLSYQKRVLRPHGEARGRLGPVYACPRRKPAPADLLEPNISLKLNLSACLGCPKISLNRALCSALDGDALKSHLGQMEVSTWIASYLCLPLSTFVPPGISKCMTIRSFTRLDLCLL